MQFLLLTGKYTKIIFSYETTRPIGTKLYRNDVRKVLYKNILISLRFFCTSYTKL